jgi:CubicO group peptidase (beta-lactamase class C family)
MSYTSLHSLFEIIWSRKSSLLSVTLLMYGIVAAGNISAANSVIDAPSFVTLKAHVILSNPPSQIGTTKAAGDTFTITGKLREAVNSLIDNGSNAAIVIGLVDPNGTQFYGYGKMSAANQTKVDENTVFGIGSITKSFTTLLLADMANRGIVNLNDSIGKYLPSTVKTPTYSGKQITLEDLATYTSGLPHDPPNIALNGIRFQKYTLEQMY